MFLLPQRKYAVPRLYTGIYTAEGVVHTMSYTMRSEIFRCSKNMDIIITRYGIYELHLIIHKLVIHRSEISKVFFINMNV